MEAITELVKPEILGGMLELSSAGIIFGIFSGALILVIASIFRAFLVPIEQ